MPACGQQPGGGFDVRTWNTDDGLPENDVVAAVVGPDGGLLVGTRNCGIARFNGTAFRPVVIEHLPSSRVHRLVVGSGGAVYASFLAGAIASWANGRFFIEHPAEAGPGGSSWCLERHAGVIDGADCFVTQSGGLVARRIESGEPKWREVQAADASVPKPDAVDAGWRLDARGLWHISADGSEKIVPIAPPVNRQTVASMHVDREGNAWLAVRRRGLTRVRPTLFRVPTTDDGGQLPPSPYSICQDAAGAIWLSSPGGGVWRAGGHEFRQVVKPFQSAEAESVVAPRQDGGIWVATQFSGLYRQEETGRELVQPADAFARVARAVFEHDRRLLIGNEGGLFAATDDGRRLEAVPLEIARHPHRFFIDAISADAAGGLWLGATQGRLLHRSPGGDWSLHQASWPEPPQRFWTVLPDAGIPGRESAGGAWIGTLNAGLAYFDGVSFRRITTDQGLPDDTICQIVADGDGMLWLGTYRGVVRLRVSDAVAAIEGRLKRVECRRFGVADGLPVAQCSAGRQPGCLRARDGSLWFSTDAGIVTTDPSAWPPPPGPPPITIDRVCVNGAEVAWAPRTPLALEAGQRTLRFECEGVSLTRPQEVRYRWRLQGLDDAWVEGGGSAVAEFERVPPGDYAFEVQAAVADGPWSVAPARCRLSIPSFFWERPAFRLVAAVAAMSASAGLGAGLIRLRHARRVARLEREREIERERTRIARDLHDDLGASLTQIDLLGALVERCGTGSPAAAEHLHEIRGKAVETIATLDEIVWAVSPTNDTLRSLCDYLTSFAEQFFRATDVRCRLDIAPIPGDVPLPADIRHALFHSVKEALNNVVRHAAATICHVRLSADGGVLAIDVDDDGRGFDSHDHGFVPGDGLANMRSRMEAVGGWHVVDTVRGGGTRVRLAVPLRGGILPPTERPRHTGGKA